MHALLGLVKRSYLESSANTPTSAEVRAPKQHRYGYSTVEFASQDDEEVVTAAGMAMLHQLLLDALGSARQVCLVFGVVHERQKLSRAP